MKKLYYILILLTTALTLGACSDKTDGNIRRVVVLHSIDDTGDEGVPFQKYMAERFKSAGIKADIHHLYLNQLRNPFDYTGEFYLREYADSLRKWDPEVILVNEDLALEWVFKTGETAHLSESTKMLDSYFKRVPLVMAGINRLDKNQYNRYTNITGFEDIIDLKKNLSVATLISGDQSVTIEMDHTEYDAKLQQELTDQINDPNNYLINTEYLIDSEDRNYIQKNYPGKTIVTFMSARNPETNRDYSKDVPDSIANAELINRKNGISLFRKYLDECKKAPNCQLQVKHDVYSNTFIHHSQFPQFTSIRRQFNDPKHFLVAGYFSSMETQIKDQVKYAVLILNGASPKSLALNQHEKNYYMDYIAMQEFKPEPLVYKDWEDQYNIINAPFWVRHPNYYTAMLVILLAVIFGLLALAALHLIKLYYKADKGYLINLKKEEERRMFTLSSVNADLWHIKEDKIHVYIYSFEESGTERDFTVDEFRKMVLPDSLSSFDSVLNFGNHKGKNKLRLHISEDGTLENSHWYELNYTVDEKNIQKKELMGINILIDDIIATEEKLNNIHEQINDSDQKQNFLNNISHDLRTPLNAVTGFAQLITSPELGFSQEELAEFNEAIHENSDMMQKMITSVIEQTESNSTDLVIKPLKSSASQFIKRVFQTHQVLVPAHLQLYMEQDQPDRAIFIDPNKTRQVMNNFIGNAFKFTPQGSITIGWKYQKETEEVLFYCKDTGIGLAEEDRLRVFDRFFKASEEAIGTGLGLNISRQIIQEQGGEIGVESSLGKGSIFWFKLKEYKGN